MVNLFKKTISSLAAAAVVLTTSAATVQAGNSYGDVPSNAWFAPYVSALADAKVFDGTMSSFRPADTMNRAEFVKTLVAAAGLELNAESAGFSDVGSEWFAPYVNAAAKAGIIDGPMAEKGNKFFPNDSISRAAATKIALGAFGINSADYQSPAAPFTDVEGHWGEEFVTAAYNLSIVDGNTATTFSPNDSIVRAAVAKIAAYTVIASADPATHVRFEDGTSAFTVYTAENVTEKVRSVVNAAESTDEEMTEEDEEEVVEETTGPALSDGSLEISLSSDSPKGAVLPQGAAGVEVAKFDVTSNGDDVKITSLTLGRDGIGGEDNLAEVAVFGPNGVRLSKEQSYNSDDEATVSFYNGGFVVEAGETATITVVATVDTVGGASTSAAGDRVGVTIKSATAIASNATEVVGDFPITASTFEVGSQPAGELKFENDGTVASVKIGEEDVLVAKFKVTADEVEDISINSITLKETGSADHASDIANVSLYADGVKVADGVNSDKYFSFTFDSPLLIEKSKNKKFQVRADITGGAAKVIKFEIDKALDISANGSRYGYGASIDNDYDGSNTATIDAGALTVVKVDAPNDEILADKDNVVFGKVKITVNAGKDLEMEKFRVTLTKDLGAGAGAVGDTLENVELYDESTGAVYALEANGTGFQETDLGITLRNGQTYTFAVRADTALDMAEDIVFEMSMSNLGDADGNGSCTADEDLCIKETDDDTYLSDVTPSSISFKSIESVSSSATLTSLPLSAKTAVRGASDVVVYDGEINAGSADDLKVTEITFKGNAVNDGAVDPDDFEGSFDSNLISVVKLWKKEGSNETLIAEKSGSQISLGEVTFDNLSVAVAADEKVRFVTTVNIVDDENNENANITFVVADYDHDSNAGTPDVARIDIEDSDSDSVYVAIGSLDSGRVVNVTGAGELTIKVDNTDTEIGNKAKYVLGGAVSDFVASYELLSQNEETKISDLEIIATEDSGSFIDSVESVSIYANDKTTLLATESVSSATVTFDNINHIVGTTTENIYVKVKARTMGKNESGAEGEFTLALKITDSEGNESGNKNTLDINEDSGTNGQTNPSLAFLTAPVQISNVEFVSSYGGENVVSTLSNGVNKVAILKLTTNSTTNTNQDTGSELKTVLKTLNLDLNFAGSNVDHTDVTAVTLEKIGGADGAKTFTRDAGTAATQTITIDSTLDDEDTITIDGVTYVIDQDNDGCVIVGTCINTSGAADTTAEAALIVADDAGVNTTLSNVANVITVTADTAGTDGNAIAISTTDVDDLTLGGATLTGGVDSTGLYNIDVKTNMVTDRDLNNGTSTYFLVKSTIDNLDDATTASLQPSLNDIDGKTSFPSIEFETDDSNYGEVYNALYINGKSTLDADKITQ